MISDPTALSISVEVDASVVDANKSVSLGLIVTELVINAIKHAFPGQRRGKIIVGYRSAGREWALSVKDDGAGMSKGPLNAKAGLGTGIVEALAKHLHSRVDIGDSSPGTEITIVGESGAAIEATTAAA
jgi:two-component sensor histidine kinase